MSKREAVRVTTYLPPDLKNYIEQQAHQNWTSQNAEIVRAIRSRMEAEQRAAG